jgi:hypothetical protein
LRLAQANSWGDPISKITTGKWTGGVAEAEEPLLCKCKALSSKLSPAKKNFFFNLKRRGLGTRKRRKIGKRKSKWNKGT